MNLARTDRTRREETERDDVRGPRHPADRLAIQERPRSVRVEDDLFRRRAVQDVDHLLGGKSPRGWHCSIGPDCAPPPLDSGRAQFSQQAQENPSLLCVRIPVTDFSRKGSIAKFTLARTFPRAGGTISSTTRSSRRQDSWQIGQHQRLLNAFILRIAWMYLQGAAESMQSSVQLGSGTAALKHRSKNPEHSSTLLGTPHKTGEVDTGVWGNSSEFQG